MTDSVETIRIESIGAGGAGVGRLPDGKVVFVPRSAPGDEVRISILQDHRSYVHAEIEDLIERSRRRAEPGCRHFTTDRCGGCQLQHLEYEEQLAAKSRIIGDALRRIGGLDLSDPEVTPATEPFGYRNRIRLVRVPGSSPPQFGFHRYDDAARVFPLTECLVASEPVRRAWNVLRSNASSIPPETGEILIHEREDGKLDVRLRYDSAEEVPALIGPMTALLGGDSVVRIVNSRERRTVAFEQVNPAMAAVLRRYVVDELLPLQDESVLDLFGGTGAMSLLLARKGAQVSLVEADREAVEMAQERLRGAPVECRHMTVEAFVFRKRLRGKVLVNPPRTGLSKPVAAALQRHGGNCPGTRLVYVSCDPATLARDLRRLSAYEIMRVKGFDLFAQTTHVETVATLEST